MKIQKVHGREIVDSRGNPTVEVEVTLDGGAFGRAAVPSGASTGQREALELRDGDKKRYLGKGVTKAVSHINGEIAKAITGSEADQRAADEAMISLDGTENKGRLGANALLGVSMALARAAAAAAGVPLYRHLAGLHGGTDGGAVLPVPMMNILNGGAHADSSVDFQEFMVMPVGAPSFAEALRAGAEIFHTLRGILKKKGHATGVGDEGGFAPSLSSNREAVDLVLEAVSQAGYKAGDNIYLALDVASSELWNEASHTYEFKKSGEKTRTPDEMVSLYEDWVRQYPIISIEDGVAEGDWDGWRAITKALGDRVQLVGDDLFVTNTTILQRGIDEKVGQLDPDQAQSDRDRHRNARRDRDGVEGRLHQHHLAPLGRDRGHDHRRPGRGHGRRPDQDRLGEPQRPRRQVQPAAAHRRGAGIIRPLRGQGGVEAVDVATERRHICPHSCCSATARASGTRKTASPDGPTSICPNAAAKKPAPPASCSRTVATPSTSPTHRC